MWKARMRACSYGSIWHQKSGGWYLHSFKEAGTLGNNKHTTRSYHTTPHIERGHISSSISLQQRDLVFMRDHHVSRTIIVYPIHCFVALSTCSRQRPDCLASPPSGASPPLPNRADGKRESSHPATPSPRPTVSVWPPEFFEMPLTPT